MLLNGLLLDSLCLWADSAVAYIMEGCLCGTQRLIPFAREPRYSTPYSDQLLSPLTLNYTFNESSYSYETRYSSTHRRRRSR